MVVLLQSIVTANPRNCCACVRRACAPMRAVSPSAAQLPAPPRPLDGAAGRTEGEVEPGSCDEPAGSCDGGMAAPVDVGVRAEFPWSRQRVLELIRLYETEEVLWNGRSRDYHNKAQRQAALDRLSARLAVPVNEVNKKLMNLRTYYSKELAKVKRSRVRGGGGAPGQVYRSQWPFFHHMDLFLSTQVVPRKTVFQELCAEENGELEGDPERGGGGGAALGGGVPGSREDLNPDPVAARGEVSSPVGAAARAGLAVSRRRPSETLPRGQVKRHREELLLQEAVRAYRSAAASLSTAAPPPPLPPPRPEDEDDVFGKHVANELRLVGDLRSKQFAKLQIQNILFEAQFGLSQLPPFGPGEGQGPGYGLGPQPAAATSLSSPEGPYDSDCPHEPSCLLPCHSSTPPPPPPSSRRDPSSWKSSKNSSSSGGAGAGAGGSEWCEPLE
ncbi:uncharacterized protein LOC136761387 [Amia ocellicauda]|uniref:uncharacterized protein LOC136761387 n=1 Tax=Amia ocellicauda TaxID=2972642 RepID=UPI003463FD9F